MTEITLRVPLQYVAMNSESAYVRFPDADGLLKTILCAMTNEGKIAVLKEE